MSPISPLHQQRQERQRKRATWLGVLGGFVAQFCATALLVLVARPDSWFKLQAIFVLSAISGGWVAGWLAPPRSWLAPAILVVLNLGAAGFKERPVPDSPLLVAVSALGPPIGILVVAALYRRHEQQA